VRASSIRALMNGCQKQQEVKEHALLWCCNEDTTCCLAGAVLLLPSMWHASHRQPSTTTAHGLDAFNKINDSQPKHAAYAATYGWSP
jgi:hypothetical protein